ncbi:phosphate ABC transporter substrate-binding protein PstS [Nakamurella sp. YIM 132087]|uniref:Phosphate-binding protein n=1 Tax=Nakamurella alba TaxID=2665158 RepID=A0A7K1FPX8_9ACTN|nr:phosphate ABC transporter substrate-binding protein PstS [Nakamurella alba]MTD16120.1 phosphate ABC transporter substrate-binding protein PstS [Nakamurella alba]
MKLARFGGLAAALTVGVLTLAACGTDDNSSTSSTAGTTTAAATSAESSSAASSAGSETSSAGSATGSASETSGASGAALTFEGEGFTCAEGELLSSGSSAQGKVMAQWISDYNTKCNATINDYGGGGSGKGRTDFIANQTDFAGSDSAMKDDQLTEAKDTRCGGADAINLPMVTGPIALAYNVTGVDNLVLDAKTLVGIFGGTITTWNDPAIAALNPDATLPAEGIQSVHRSEDSGTTDNFTKYLIAAGEWSFEGGQAWTAPGGTGAQGSDGVAKAVAGTVGSIGYVEWGFAKDNSLNIAQIDNGSGAVELTGESAGKAVGAAEITGTAPDLTLSLDYATQEAGAYPIILVTYEIVCSANNGDKAELVKSFLGWTATDGQTELDSLGAAPLPADIQAQVVESIKSIA